MSTRDKKGRFLPGNNGGGRPKTNSKFLQLCQDNAEDAMNVLIDIMNDTKARNSDRIKAATYVVDRAYGKIPIAVEEDNTPTLEGIKVKLVKADD